MAPDTEYRILENIYSTKAETPVNQRDLAHVAGLSLGMTNAILKRLVEKGWVTLRKINGRSLQYAVTPEGVNEIVRRGYGYLRRTIKDIADYKETLETFLLEKKRKGFSTLLLIGSSDLEFIIDHLCVQHGIGFLKRADPAMKSLPAREGLFILYAEGITEDTRGSDDSICYLARVLIPHREKAS